MIRYTLKCSENHAFESWFRSADDFDGQKARGLVGCPVCGCADVQKSLMAPPVTTSRRKAAAPAPGPQTPSETQSDLSEPPAPNQAPQASEPAQTTPADDQETAKKIAEMRKHVEQNSDYVGSDFAAEARKMHEGDAEARSIYGEAKLDEAKALIEDGVPVVPLPFAPKQKMN